MNPSKSQIRCDMIRSVASSKGPYCNEPVIQYTLDNYANRTYARCKHHTLNIAVIELTREEYLVAQVMLK
jgi:hypothetical protein